jgi:hypothetical protein
VQNNEAGKTRRAAIAFVALAAASWWACTSKVDDSAYPLVNVGVGYGDTCGQIENHPDLVQAYCDASAACVTLAHSYPDAGAGLTLGMCTDQPHDGCVGDAGCPSGFECAGAGDRDGVVDLCLKTCATSADCPAPFQVCSFDHCQVQDCSLDEECGDGAHCSDMLCVRGDASTR